MMTYLIHCVDKGLSISPRETTNHISHVPAREDCLDEGYEFTFGDGTADQSLQGLFTRVENGRWLSGERGRCGIFGENDVLIRKWVRYWGVRFTESSVKFTPCQYIPTGSPIENTNAVYIEQVVGEG